MRAAIGGTDAVGDFLTGHQTRRFLDRLLAVAPLRLNWVQPRTRAWQPTRHQPHAGAILLHLPVMLPLYCTPETI